ncbi:1-phosphatidylinositol 4,5-bisphosphate phosphodiesterase gamma-1-like isoform X1 [Lytechinus variegatus]|uniref:1-phosphatidylinositol 4,5-bisphosphate phosphodiesterase gamma-1-like isoform X1 n=1 Tax=Lytechinus variegatus TaxID=7654 RepID=UPI001BB18F3A|nr:1-phosphatidylinositol 4,5-bisphosphate phosphodiesterase gamma-1-like isoform X1 [Lytechinus variegatus]XP_041454202.1 1-phosphatidylinositol 4,5-bisphosphate phosphodiesterase gamma-1-like isoform X1 [Lytechinus variegatus]
MAVIQNGTMELTEQDIHSMQHNLALGTLLTRFYGRKRPERKSFEVNMETRQVVWRRQGGRTEGAINIREIKEIRPGKVSKDFEKWPEEHRRHPNNICFVVFYGTEFRLKTLSVAAVNADEYHLWITGLKWLAENTEKASYPLQVRRWLRREFYAMGKNKTDTVSLRDMKSFLPRINLKMNTRELRENFNEADRWGRQEIPFDGLLQLYNNLVFQQEVADRLREYYNDMNRVTLNDYIRFLAQEQKDPVANNPHEVKQYIKKYFADSGKPPVESDSDLSFTVQEFVDYLYSKDNEIWNRFYDNITDDMDRPLCDYWIASSHNTYLTGDQVSSESSVEAYARCLRMGCRCLELDCWDGPDGLPIIYHGHTLTTKIRFYDVLKTIKEHAWITTDFPIILSIENHCSLLQQRNMACLFQEVFGENLLTQPIDRDANSLPAVSKLKRKIILKHKKLPDNGNETFTVPQEDSLDFDLRNSTKNGILLLEDPLDQEWAPHYFVLTDTKLYYSEETNTQASQDDDDDASSIEPATPNEELHYSEPWFHGKLNTNPDQQPRTVADELLTRYQQGDGTFLVRESETFKGDYSLSFWAHNQVNHCRIRSKSIHGKTCYYLVENLPFPNLYTLVNFYRERSIKGGNGITVKLKDTVPQLYGHENAEWFHSRLSRHEAEDMLKRVRQDGAFLVRKSERENDAFAISFRADGKIKHCRIKQEGRLFTIGSAQFESLAELCSYYHKYPLYRKMKLKSPVNQEVVDRVGGDLDPEDDPIYGTGGIYMDPNQFVPKVTVKALYDYKAQREDELSFCKHAIITNVDKQDHGWWKGDYGGKKNMWFPSNYVEEVTTPATNDQGQNATLLGNLQKGAIDINGCSVEMMLGVRTRQHFVFRIISPTQRNAMDVAATDLTELEDWMKCIQEASVKATVMTKSIQNHERRLRIAREFSRLIVYCRSVPFSEDNIPGKYFEMSSFPETKVERYMVPGKSKILVDYNRKQVSRTYPKGQRIDSSNYDPIPIWFCGCQMVSLNYQTPDRHMQVNEGMFALNGRCGYVLKPECMFDKNFDSFDKRTLSNVDPIHLTITIIAARHLQKTGRGIASPFVEVEVLGSDYDSGNKYKTSTKADNGFNPVFNEVCEFDVSNPDLAMLRFVIQDEDVFGEPNFLGQATYPLKAIRTGYRSVQLKNGYSEELELATLLVHVDRRVIGECDDSDLYASIQMLRERTQELTAVVNTMDRPDMDNGAGGGESDAFRLKTAELNNCQEALFNLQEQRKQRVEKRKLRKTASNSQSRLPRP